MPCLDLHALRYRCPFDVVLSLVPYRAVSWEVGRRYCRPMESEKSSGCPLHGGGAAAQSLVGHLLAEVVGSRHVYGGDSPAGPLDAVRNGRPWSLPLEDRALLVAVYWRTNLTMRQFAPLFGSGCGFVPVISVEIAKRSKGGWRDEPA
jgi:hypothetical protein